MGSFVPGVLPSKDNPLSSGKVNNSQNTVLISIVSRLKVRSLEPSSLTSCISVEHDVFFSLHCWVILLLMVTP